MFLFDVFGCFSNSCQDMVAGQWFSREPCLLYPIGPIGPKLIVPEDPSCALQVQVHNSTYTVQNPETPTRGGTH